MQMGLSWDRIAERDTSVLGGKSFESWAIQRDREGFLGMMAKGLQNQSDRFFLARPGGQEEGLFSISFPYKR